MVVHCVQADEVMLITPCGVTVDQVVWDGITIAVTDGASIERTAFDPTATWTTAQAAWLGSAGDLGSPGAAYSVPPATPTPLPTPTIVPTVAPTLPPAVAPRLYLSEIMANPAAVGVDMGECI